MLQILIHHLAHVYWVQTQFILLQKLEFPRSTQMDEPPLPASRKAANNFQFHSAIIELKLN